MKPLSTPELVSFCEWLKPQLFGSQLQDLWTDGETLLLQFYRSGEQYLIIRLTPNSPMIWLQARRPRLKKNPKPVTLFLASHGRNKLVQDLSVNISKGRTVMLTLSGREEICEIELDLIPKTPNLTVRAQGKQISWNKPRDLPPPVLSDLQEVHRDWKLWCEEARQYFFAEPVRAQARFENPNTQNNPNDLSSLDHQRFLKNQNFKRTEIGPDFESVPRENSDQGSNSHLNSNPDPSANSNLNPNPILNASPRPKSNQSSSPQILSPEQKATARAIEKKRRALEAMQLQLDSGESDRYRALGESLKSSSEVPTELADLYDEKRTPMENLQRVFQKAKDLERKRQGTQDRKAIIEKEIEKLLKSSTQAGANSSSPTPTPTISFASRVMKKGEAAGRKLQVEGFEAVIGKSGSDNLAILRQSRAWDFWLHLKDEPGAHAILFRNRQQEVPAHVIQKVAEWVWSESRGKKAILGQGKYEVLVVECRFVKPIKGDKLGRVNYSNPRVYTFASKDA